MKRYDGKTNINARVNIKYLKDKPARVKFAYPDKHNQVRGSLFFEIVVGWVMVTWFIALLFGTKFINLISNHSLIYFIILIILSWITDKILLKNTLIYPKVQAFFTEKKYMFFDKNSEFKEKNYFEIPYFHNIFLEFKTTGEFDKYLKEIDIKEYPFYTYGGIKIEKNTKKKKKMNEFVWYVRFYYSQKPKNGYLVVRFA